MLQTHSEIDSNLTRMVNFNQFGASSIDIFIYAFTKTIIWDKYHKVKQDGLLKVGNIITINGAEIASPTSIKHMQTDVY